MEVCLGTIMFFVLALGVVEFGKAFYIYSELLTAARMGARYLASHNYEMPNWRENARNLVVFGRTVPLQSSRLLPGLRLQDVQIGTDATPPNYVTVRIQYKIFPFVGIRKISSNIYPQVTLRYLQPNL